MAESSNQEKTEPATPKKREEARKEGQVARSNDLITALTLMGALVALAAAGPTFVDAAKGMFSQVLLQNGTMPLQISEIKRVFITAMVPVGFAGMALVLPMAAVGLLANILQVGVKLTPKSLSPKFNRIDPIQGFSRIFSWASVGTFTTGMLKLFAVGGIAYLFVVTQFNTFPQLARLRPIEIFSYAGGLMTTLGWRVAAAMLLIGLADYIFQRWRHERDLRMSKQEVKDELKQQDGDPQIKQRIRQIQRQNAMRRMMEDVPKATVVITNPTHYAVALQYDATMGAPRVVAKGQRKVALRIKALAKEHGVPIEEDKPLARGLFRTTEVGQEIPPEFYQAIAQVMAVIMRNKNSSSVQGA